MHVFEYGVILGRFQPFHIGHLEFAEAARDKCDHLVIGVTNPNIERLVGGQSDSARSLDSSNPFTYFQRTRLIRAALRDADWSEDRFTIVPADLNDLHQLEAFLPSRRVMKIFVTIYDAWGEEKMKLLQDFGFDTETLWRRSMSERAASGTQIRQLLREQGRWQHLVSTSTAELISFYFLEDKASNPDNGAGD